MPNNFVTTLATYHWIATVVASGVINERVVHPFNVGKNESIVTVPMAY